MWSLDGHHLAFEVNRLSGDIEMFLANGDVANARALRLPGGSKPFGPSGSVITSAAFHPQGVLVFEASNQGGAYRLYYTHIDGGAPQELLPATTMAGNLMFPSVSADGSQMAFIASATGSCDIYIRDSGTGEVTQLSNTVETESSRMLSADAKTVVFSRKHDGTEDVFELVIGSQVVTAVASGSGEEAGWRTLAVIDITDAL